MKMKFIIIALLLLLILFGSFYFLYASDDETLNDPMQECVRVGGEWITFDNGCADYCWHVRNPETSCTAELTDSCECGENKCWNGETCEDN